MLSERWRSIPAGPQSIAQAFLPCVFVRMRSSISGANQHAAPLAANLGLVRPPAIYLTTIVTGLVLHFVWPIPLVPSDAVRGADSGACR